MFQACPRHKKVMLNGIGKLGTILCIDSQYITSVYRIALVRSYAPNNLILALQKRIPCYIVQKKRKGKLVVYCTHMVPKYRSTSEPWNLDDLLVGPGCRFDHQEAAGRRSPPNPRLGVLETLNHQLIRGWHQTISTRSGKAGGGGSWLLLSMCGPLRGCGPRL